MPLALAFSGKPVTLAGGPTLMNSSSASGSSPKAVFPGSSEMAARMRAFDWDRTELGAPEYWPESLKTAVRLMLASRQPVWLGWGFDLIYLYNDPYRDIVGGRHPSAFGRPVRDVWPEIWDVIAPMLAAAMSGQEGTYVEEQLLIMERNGYREETYYTFSYTPISDEHGTNRGIFCANSDDTQRVLSERRFAALGAVAAAMTDAQNAGQACMRSAATLAAYKHDVPFAIFYLANDERTEARLAACVGLPTDHPAAPPSLPLRKAAAAGQPWPLDGASESRVELAKLDTWSLPGGPWPEVTHSAMLLPLTSSSQERPFGYLVAGVSPRRLLDDRYRGFFELLAGTVASGVLNARAFEQEWRRAEALAEIDRAKTAFFSNVSHEFRTPLTLMLAPLEEMLAQRDSGLPSASIDSLELIKRNGLRLLRLVNTLLDFSRIEAGRVQASFEPTDLGPFTAELASVFRAATERAGLRLIAECGPLPEPVFVDREMWEKIVLNLLSNAFKFTFDGEIAVTLTSDGHTAELRVRDTGVGIPAAEMPRLFERFHRVESSRSRTHEGSGIGLALVQELARLHGGNVRAESVPSQGTTLIVSVPLGRAHLPADRIGTRQGSPSAGAGAVPFVEEAMRWIPEAQHDAPATEPSDDVPLPAPGSSAAPGERRPLVLVADDNADMRQYVTRLLSGRYEVLQAPDGETALMTALQRHPDLILSDVMMPRLDGFGLVRALRDDDATRTIPIVLLSARAGEESRVEGLDVGADDYLVKPFSARELLARVESHLKLAQARESAEQRVRRILESITDGFALVDAEGRYTQFNSAALALFQARGYAEPELLGRRVFDLFPFIRETSGGRTLERTLHEGQPTSAESYIPEWQRWFSVRHFPMPDGGAATFFQDITEQRQAELKLEAWHETFRDLVENSPFGIFAVDADFRLAQASTGARKTFGEAKELIGRDFDDLLRTVWPEPFVSEAIGHFRHTLETGEPYRSPSTVEQRVDRAQVESYDWRIERMTLPDGRPGVVCHFYDLSERQEYEARLRESEARFRLLAESLPQFVWEEDAEGTLLFINQRFLKFSGLTFEEARDDRRLATAVHPEDAARLFNAGAQARATSKPMHLEARLRRHDGEYRWFIVRTEPVLRDGQVYRWFGSSQDVTEQVRAQEALQRSAEEAHAADRAKDNFLAALSHELRTPLTPVLMNAAALREDSRLPADAREELAMIERNIALEARLIDDLLDLTRIAKGKLELRPQPCDAHSLIGLALEIVRDDALSKGIVLERDFAAPKSGLPADPARFQQVIWNLLRNAVKFTPHGGRIRISTRNVTKPGGEAVLRIEVQDSGEGIKAEALQRIFAPFEQGSASSGHRFGGLGLGLAIARAIVDLHEGTIFAQSDGPGTGATFVVEFPGAVEPPPGAEHLGGTHGAAYHVPEAPLKLLLVEDHEPTLQVLSRLLSRAGHQLSTARSLAEAFAAAAASEHDLVISDLGLPDGTGIELMEHLRSRYGLTGIALSGYGMEEDLARSRAAGFRAHLIKPVDFDQLRRALREVAATLA